MVNACAFKTMKEWHARELHVQMIAQVVVFVLLNQLLPLPHPRRTIHLGILQSMLVANAILDTVDQIAHRKNVHLVLM